MDGSLAERRQRDISPGNVESPRARGKTEGGGRGMRDCRGVWADGTKGDEVEGWARGRDGEWHTLEVAKRRKGKGAGATDKQGVGDGTGVTARFSLGEATRTSFSEPLRPVPLRPSWKPLYPLKLIYIEILNDTHRPEQ